MRPLPTPLSRRASCPGIPAPTWVVFFAIDRHRGAIAQQIAGCVEGVDSHIEQEHIGHRIAEPAEVRADIKISVQNADFADMLHEATVRPQPRIVAPALTHHVAYAGAL